MQEHQTRVVEERDQLGDKMTRLGQFIMGDVFRSLDSAERVRLRVQYDWMKGYYNILTDRIIAFKE